MLGSLDLVTLRSPEGVAWFCRNARLPASPSRKNQKFDEVDGLHELPSSI